jgi:phage terminase small subunit
MEIDSGWQPCGATNDSRHPEAAELCEQKKDRSPSGPRRRIVSAEFLKDHNAAASYRRAGYRAASNHVASVSAAKLLASPGIQAEISRLVAEQLRRVEVDTDAILREWLLIAHQDIGDVLDFSGDEIRLRRPADITPTARRTIAALKIVTRTEGSATTQTKVEVKFSDKMTALAHLGRHLGLLKPGNDEQLDALLAAELACSPVTVPPLRQSDKTPQGRRYLEVEGFSLRNRQRLADIRQEKHPSLAIRTYLSSSSVASAAKAQGRARWRDAADYPCCH